MVSEEPPAGQLTARKSPRGRFFFVRVAVLALIAAGFLKWNLPWLKAGLWRDEAGSVYVASASTLEDYFHRYAQMDYSPPLFNGLVAVWGRLCGLGPQSLAIFAALMAAVALSAVGLAAFEVAGSWAALLAILFCLDSDILFWELHQIRPYMLTVASISLTLACAVRLRRKIETGDARRRSVAAMQGALILLAFSHYSGTVAVAFLGVTALVGMAVTKDAPRATWRITAACAAVSGAAFLPWIPVFLRQARLDVPWDLGPLAARLRLLGSEALMLLPQFGPHDQPASLLPALLIGLIVVLRWRTIRQRLPGGSFPLAFAGPAGLGVLFLMGWKGGATRYLVIPATIIAILFAALVVAVGRDLVERGVRKPLVAWLGVLLAAGPIYGEAYRWSASKVGEYSPARSGVRLFFARAAPARQDLFVASPNYLARTLWYYGVPEASLRGFPQFTDLTGTQYSLDSAVWRDPAAIPQLLDRIGHDARTVGFRRIVLVTDFNPGSDPAASSRAIYGGLTTMFRLVDDRVYPGLAETVRISVFEVP